MNNRFKLFFYPLLFAAMWIILYVSGRHMLFVQEQLQLFQNDWHYVHDNLFEIGGAVRMLTEAIVQFYRVPWIGITLLTAVAVMSVCSFSSCLTIVYDKKNMLLPLSVVPVLPLLYSAVVYQDTSAITAFLVTASVSAAVLRINGNCSWMVSALLAPVLYCLCGATAMLLPLLSLFSGIARTREKGMRQVLPSVPLLTYVVFGIIAVRLDLTGEASSFYACSSWAPASLVIALTFLLSRVVKESRMPMFMLSSGAAALVLTVAALWADPGKTYAQNVDHHMYVRWAELHYLYENGRYSDLLDLYESAAPENSVESNYINLALYKTGRLTSDFFRYKPKWMHHSLQASWIDMAFPFPYVWVETCNEMGALSKARQAAFEGNVIAGPGGSAPMVRYLAENSIIRGEYVVADKYLSCLENTVYYRKWAESQRRFMSDEAVASDPYYSAKRACLYKEDRTLYDMNDLWLTTEIFKNNPEHGSTFDYTGIMVLSAGEINTFVDWIMKMTEAGVVKVPLAPVFQDALVMAFQNNPKLLELYMVEPSRLSQFKEFSAAVNGTLSNKAQINTILSKNDDRLWYYIYSLMRSTNRKNPAK